MKISILLARTGVRQISSVACGFSPVKILFSDDLKSLISRINEVNVFFNKISLKGYFTKKFIYYHLFCCNHTCFCVGVVL